MPIFNFVMTNDNISVETKGKQEKYVKDGEITCQRLRITLI